MTQLSPAQIETFRRDGFLAPVEVFPAEEARRWRADLEAFERTLPPGPVAARYRRKLHVRLPWARSLIEDPRLLDVMESLLGPDLLVFTSTFFVKDAGTDAITAWHQDATYFGLQPYEHVTAWVALSEASVEAGCMRFIPGSHNRGQMRHGPEVVPGSINAGGQTIAGKIDDTGARLAPVGTGQISLHHTLVLHSSAPNRSADRRIGFGISFIPARLRHTGSRRHSVTLVRGKDQGNFELEPDPRTMTEAERIDAHTKVYDLYRFCYDEQIARHQGQAA